MSKPVFSQSQVIRQLTESWGDTTHPRQWYGSTVTYSIGQGSSKFPPAGNELAGLTPMTGVETNSAAFAFGLWQDVIPLNLLPQSFNPAADITLNFSATANDGSSGDGKSSYTHVDLNTFTGQPDQILGERIWIGTSFGADFDPKTNKVVTPVSDDYYYLGSYLILNLMHEIGHALGLSHPDTYDISGGEPLSFTNNATYSGDFRKYSIMSYFGSYKAGVGWTSADDFHSKVGTDSYPQTPMRDDILAIQALYGANFNTRSGDTHYGFHADAGLKSSAYDFTYNTAPLLTIWDGGGIDTLDLSGTSRSQTIDLRPGAYSSVLGLSGNVAIAYECVIENAVGGRGNDRILGNSAANILTPGAGNDRLEGGAGSDVFAFRAAELTASDKVAGGSGFDQLAMKTAGTVAAGGVSGVETFVLANGGANRLALANANFTGVTGGLIRVFGGDKGNTIDASALTGTKVVVALGGSGGDLFKFSAASLLAADTVVGSGGADTLLMTGSGKLATGGVGGVESYRLAGLGANSLALKNANFDGVTGALITVSGGAKGNTVSAALVTGSRRAVMVGGAGKDLFTGGAGNDVFKFSATGLSSADLVRGGAGSDQLVMGSAGTVRVSSVAGIESYVLAGNAANGLILTNANFVGAAGASITVVGGAKGNTLSAASVTGPRRVTLTGGAGKDVFTGGAGNDAFRFTASALASTDMVRGGAGSDQLVMGSAGTVRVSRVAGVESYVLAGNAANGLTLTNANFVGAAGGSITVVGGARGNTVSAASVTGPRRVTLTGGAGKDVFTGGSGNDIFRFSASALAATDVVKGGPGRDQLVMTTSGTAHPGGVAGVETYVLANANTGRLTLSNANFTGAAGGSITVVGGAKGNTVSAATVTGTRRVSLVGGAGKDAFTGGAGNDIFRFTASSLAGTDLVRGGAGTDQLVLATAGTVRAGGVAGVESYALAGGRANSLTLANANFTGVSGALITVSGGSGGNTIRASGLTGANRVVLTGGVALDTMVVGRRAAMTGGGGRDRFELTTPGSTASPNSITIADFAHGADKIGFRETGFALSPAPSAATLFKASSTGGFTGTAQRFAYDTTDGRLYFDHDGSRGASPHQLIATLSHHPTLSAADLFFFA